MLERYFSRVHEARFGQGPPGSNWTPEQRQRVHDDMLTYMVHAHHLKDWLAASGHRIAHDAASNPALRLCADIANGTKHATLTKPRVGQLGEQTAAMHLIIGRDGKMTAGADLELVVGETRTSGYEVMTEVRTAWIAILTATGLEVDPKVFNRPSLRFLRPAPDSSSGPDATFEHENGAR